MNYHLLHIVVVKTYLKDSAQDKYEYSFYSATMNIDDHKITNALKNIDATGMSLKVIRLRNKILYLQTTCI